MYHIDKCHINPASGRVFCYNISIEKKNFCPMNLLAKVLLGMIVYNNVVTRKSNTKERCGRVRNMDFPKIPNNGGL